MLVGKGFSEVYNLSGGIKAWQSQKAIGPEDLGLDLFSGQESPQQSLVTAFSLEAGLQDFYLLMIPQVDNEAVVSLFEKLARIEVKHQERILTEYNRLAASQLSRQEFQDRYVTPAMEGGLTSEEYLQLYQPDLEVVEEVISLALAIEAQALDLYQRAAQNAGSEPNRAMLMQIADEERAHMAQLAKLFDNR